MGKQSWWRDQAGRVRRGLGNDPGPEVQRGRDATFLDSHPLFDDEWYSLVTGARGERQELVDHYLGTPVADRVSPNPLFDPAWFAAHFAGDLAGKDPFLVFARRKRWRTPFHPLFALRRYRRAAEGAAEHPYGPLGHHLEACASETGDPVGPNEWWPAERGSLRDWLVQGVARHRDRVAASAAPVATRAAVDATSAQPCPPATAEVVDVVLAPGFDEEQLRVTLASLVAQTHTAWHVLTTVPEGTFDVVAVLTEVLPAEAWDVVDVPAGHRPSLDAAVVAAGSSAWITFLDAGDLWHPERLARLLHAAGDEHDVLADVMTRTTPTGQSRRARAGLAAGDPSRSERLARGRLLVRRDAWAALAAPALDAVADLPSGHEFAAVRALAAPRGIDVHPFVGVTRDESARERARRVPLPLRPVFDHGAVRAWDDVVLRRRLLDLGAARTRPTDPDVVSVVVPTYADTHMTLRAVDAVVETTAGLPLTVQVVVVDNGCRPEQAAVLDSLELRHEHVEVLHLDTNLGFALGNDLALPLLRGATTVFLNNDTEVTEGWLQPLVEALDDRQVLGAQSLLLYPDGSVQCAGIAFPTGGGVPHGFGQWHPREDLEEAGELRFRAATAACLAMRTADVLALGGFDPVFLNGMEDVDLCLRAAERAGDAVGSADAPGRFVVRPDSVVWHHESVSPGRFRRYATNRRVFLDRWHGRLPGDDVELWGRIGFEVLGHRVENASGRERTVAVPRPVLRRAADQRQPRVEGVSEAAPRLRWAIKNPAPAGPYGERWGDTHFAESLAEALRDAGQEVVLDRREAWERRTSGLDDVSLVLRGIGAFHPAPDQVNLAWVISHPDDVGGAEARAFDKVLAASVTWARDQTARWGFEVEPMLQATDRRRFHPDLAVPDTGHPVLFVGSSRKQQRPLVQAAVEANLLLSVYGTEWEGIVPRRFVKDTYLPNREVGAAYRAAGVVLNDHWEDMRTSGFLSNRLFDAAASGARVVTDDVAGLGDIFGRSVQVARTPDDLVRLATLRDPDEVFGDDAERRAVAMRIHAEHSFAARADRLVRVALEAHRRRGLDRF